jgi:hypothetical protein
MAGGECLAHFMAGGATPWAGSAAVERSCYSPVLAYMLFHARVAELVDAGPWHRAF